MNINTVIIIFVLFIISQHSVYAVPLKECVQTVLTSKAFRQEVCSEASARASGPGWSGRINTDVSTACITTTGGDYQIVGGANIEITQCISNRCKVSKVRYERDSDQRVYQACADVETYSESKSFGGGGQASIKLCAIIEKPYPVEEIIRVIDYCEKMSD